MMVEAVVGAKRVEYDGAAAAQSSREPVAGEPERFGREYPDKLVVERRRPTHRSVSASSGQSGGGITS
jgi:hypothetical protein